MVEVKQRVSVRTLVEFVLRSGDLQAGVTGSSRAVEGIRAHQFLQKNRGEDYQPEVILQTTYLQDGFTLEIHGRADGIFKKESGICIEEIKSTSIDLDLIDESISTLHWAQAQCYAYILAKQENYEHVEVQLTYFHLDTQDTKTYTRVHEVEELRVFFLSLVQSYLEWARKLDLWSKLRNTSIRNLEFPYPRISVSFLSTRSKRTRCGDIQDDQGRETTLCAGTYWDWEDAWHDISCPKGPC